MLYRSLYIMLGRTQKFRTSAGPTPNFANLRPNFMNRTRTLNLISYNIYNLHSTYTGIRSLKPNSKLPPKPKTENQTPNCTACSAQHYYYIPFFGWCRNNFEIIFLGHENINLLSRKDYLEGLCNSL